MSEERTCECGHQIQNHYDDNGLTCCALRDCPCAEFKPQNMSQNMSEEEKEIIQTLVQDDDRILSVKSPFCSCGKVMSDDYEIELSGVFYLSELKEIVEKFPQK